MKRWQIYSVSGIDFEHSKIDVERIELEMIGEVLGISDSLSRLILQENEFRTKCRNRFHIYLQMNIETLKHWSKNDILGEAWWNLLSSIIIVWVTYSRFSIQNQFAFDSDNSEKTYVT